MEIIIIFHCVIDGIRWFGQEVSIVQRKMHRLDMRIVQIIEDRERFMLKVKCLRIVMEYG